MTHYLRSQSCYSPDYSAILDENSILQESNSKLLSENEDLNEEIKRSKNDNNRLIKELEIQNQARDNLEKIVEELKDRKMKKKVKKRKEKDLAKAYQTIVTLHIKVENTSEFGNKLLQTIMTTGNTMDNKTLWGVHQFFRNWVDSSFDLEKAFDGTANSLPHLPPTWFETLDFQYDIIIVNLIKVVLELLSFPEIRKNVDEASLYEKMSKFCHLYLCDPRFQISLHPILSREICEQDFSKLSEILIQADVGNNLRNQLDDYLYTCSRKHNYLIPNGWQYPRTQNFEERKKEMNAFSRNPCLETWKQLPVPISIKNLTFRRGLIFFHDLKKFEERNLPKGYCRKLPLLKQHYILYDSIDIFQFKLIRSLGKKLPEDVVSIEDPSFSKFSLPCLRNYVRALTHSPVSHFVRGATLCRYILILLRLTELTKKQNFKVFVASFALEALDQLLGYCGGSEDKKLGFPELNHEFWKKKRSEMDKLVPCLFTVVSIEKFYEQFPAQKSFTEESIIKQIMSFQNTQDVEVDMGFQRRLV